MTWTTFIHNGPEFHVNTETGECITTAEISRQKEAARLHQNNERQRQAQWEREDEEYWRRRQFEHVTKNKLLLLEINQRYPIGSKVILFHTKGKHPEKLVISSPAKIVNKSIFYHGDVDLGQTAIFVKDLWQGAVRDRRIYVSDIDELGIIEHDR